MEYNGYKRKRVREKEVVIMPKTITREAMKIRDGIFVAPSRTYAETYVEPLIRSLYSLSPADNNSYDAKASDGTKYEIKTSKVMKKKSRIKGSMFNRIVAENDASPLFRFFPFEEAKKIEFDSNIQNVKRDDFDVLLYVLLFADYIKIFEIKAEDVASVPNWSDKHGRYDAFGKSGQFSINQTNIDKHISKWLKKTITWNEAADIYRKL